MEKRLTFGSFLSGTSFLSQAKQAAQEWCAVLRPWQATGGHATAATIRLRK